MGAKGLVYLGEHTLLACIRDDNTHSFPGWLDLVGGGREPRSDGTLESPFETFRRETREEVSLRIKRRHVVYARQYVSALNPEYTGVFFVAQLPESAIHKVSLGDEGKHVEYFDSLASLISRSDLIPVLRQRAEDYADFIGASLPLQAQIA